VVSTNSLAPEIKPLGDLVLDDKKAIQDTDYDVLTTVLYPMLCRCAHGGQQEPCRFRPDGHRGRLPTRRKMLWSFPQFCWAALWWHKSGHQKKFYVDDFPQASLGLMATFIVLSILIDAFTDPAMASWTDSCKSKHGRRRPFILVSAFVVPIVFLLNWTPPSGLDPTGAALWYGIFHIAVKLADTLYNIPSNAWGGALTPNSKERTNVWAWRDFFYNIGILIGIGIGPMVVDGIKPSCSSSPGDGCLAMPLLTGFFGLLFLVGSLMLVHYGKEPTYEQMISSAEGKDGPLIAAASAKSLAAGPGTTEEDVIPMMLTSSLNRNFNCILISVFAKAAGDGVPFTVLPFMAEWVLGSKCLSPSLSMTLGSTVMLLTGVASLVLWVRAAARWGKFWAYLGFHIALMGSSLAYLCVGNDQGDCAMTGLFLALTFCWGAACGGSFLQFDMVCDCIDYDELLTGGRRREAVYMMATEFIPKFITIPGDSIPLVLMGILNYARKPLYKLPCDAASIATANSTLSGDAFCAAKFGAEPAGAVWCAETTCAQQLANGVTFVCTPGTVTDECGIMQPPGVQWLFIICFSIVPAIFVGMGLFALSRYPKEARAADSHEKLLEAITQVKRGKTVEDPWRPGCFVPPACARGPSFGSLSYFWPAELHRALESGADESGVDYSTLFWRTLAKAAIILVTLVPCGLAVMILGMMEEDKSTDWKLPIGMMIAGFGGLGVWWHGTRARVARALQQNPAPRAEVVSYINFLRPFQGLPLLQVEAEGGTAGPAPEAVGTARA